MVDVASPAAPDALTVGRQLRHYRRQQQRTLGDIAACAGISTSALSLIENGKRETRLSVLTALATALGVSLNDVLTVTPPNRRSALEIELEKAQREDSFQSLGIPAVRPGRRLPTEALEALVGLHQALAAIRAERSATPEEARRANARLRARMREQDNYFADVEQAATDLLGATGYLAGPI